MQQNIDKVVHSGMARKYSSFHWNRGFSALSKEISHCTTSWHSKTVHPHQFYL